MTEAKKPRLLLVCCRPKDALKDAPLPEHQEWFQSAMGLEKGQIKTIYAIDQQYPDASEFDAVIIGGSKYSVYDDLPWVADLEDFIRSVFANKTPYLGVCFGHQIAIQALGGTVARGENGSEVGATTMKIADEAASDPLFYNVPKNFMAAQFHQDIVAELPSENVKAIAFNDTYPVQACAIGEKGRTLQFHPEFTSEIMDYIIRTHGDELLEDGMFLDRDHMERVQNGLNDGAFRHFGEQIARNFYEHFVL